MIIIHIIYIKLTGIMTQSFKPSNETFSGINNYMSQYPSLLMPNSNWKMKDDVVSVGLSLLL